MTKTRHSSARSATSPSNVATRTFQRASGRYLPTSALRRSSPAVVDDELARPAAPVIGRSASTRHCGPSVTPRAASASRAIVRCLGAADGRTSPGVASSDRPQRRRQGHGADRDPCGSCARTGSAAVRLSTGAGSRLRRRQAASMRRCARREAGVRPRAGLRIAGRARPRAARTSSARPSACCSQMPGASDEEDRQREPDDVEGKVQDDAGEQAEVEVEQPEADRRDDQLDGPGEGGLRWIRRVPCAKDDGLDDEGDSDERVRACRSGRR